MSDRVAAVFARSNPQLPVGLVDAMLADVVDLVTDAELVDPAIVVAEGYDAATWPGITTVAVGADPTITELLLAAQTPDATAVAVVVADVPDLPVLLLGKLFSALAGPRGAGVAACPAEGGGLVAVAAMLPLSGWLRQASLRFDAPDAMDALRAAAPMIELSVGPGWHRIRGEADLARLDPGLEGWEATRSYLTR
jgi:2-phospho-L-lactate guanylyltransferase (CobY/MobA/RfbA family)